MAEVSLAIHGQSYGIACDDGQEQRLMELGRYVDQRLREIAGAGAATTESHLLVLTSLVLTDEIYELRETLQNMQNAPQGQVSHDTAAPQQQAGMSQEDESAVMEVIEQLSARIDSVSSRLDEI